MPGDDGSIEVTVGATPTKEATKRSSDPAQRQAVEDFSVKVAVRVPEGRYPGLSIEPPSSSDPGQQP